MEWEICEREKGMGEIERRKLKSCEAVRRWWEWKREKEEEVGEGWEMNAREAAASCL